MSNVSDDWTPESAAAIRLCKEWARALSQEIACQIYLFGSAIYKGGDQFDAELSDLDIIVLFLEDVDASRRVSWLETLRAFKKNLELQMIPALHRTDCVEPGVSVVPITALELQANIHKSGSRRFFDKNIFLDLITDEQSVGIPNAAVGTLPDDNRQALEYAQKVRNLFLAVSGNATGGLAPFDGVDPLPKALARVAAQLVPDAEEGEWYDTRLGLEYLWEEITRRRSESGIFQQLYNTMSIRRGGRGRRRVLTGRDQLLLAEILYDLAAAVALEPLLTWEIRLSGVMPTSDVLDRLRRLVPDARVLSVRQGSLVIRLRSSERAYDMVRLLDASGILPKLFGADAVQVGEPGDPLGFSRFESEDAADRLARRISEWRPGSTVGYRETEAELAAHLDGWLRDMPDLRQAILQREAMIGESSLRRHADFLLTYDTADNRAVKLVIELVRLRSRSSFFQHLEHALQFGLPTILVVIGPSRQLEGLQGDIERLSHVSGQIRVIPIPLDSDAQ